MSFEQFFHRSIMKSCMNPLIFKGEKNNGFDVLYQNMRNGLDSSKEFADFLRESCIVEETYVKLQLKLVAKVTSNCSSKGSFSPYWQVLRTYVEKLNGIHQQLSSSWQDLCRDLQKYMIEQQRTHREVKEHEAGTIETIQGIQQTLTVLQKAKENYHARCVEYEKLKRENASARDLEKVESKFKKANDDYRAFVDKYANIRNEFEAKMTEACKRFQQIEESHLQQMKDFVDVYAKTWEQKHSSLDMILKEFCTSSNSLSVDHLIDTLVQSKTTGTEKPGPIELEEADLITMTPPLSTPDMDRRDTPTSQEKAKKDASAQRFPMFSDTASHVSGIFTKRREKKKKKSEKDNKDRSDTDVSEVAPGSLIDDDGYTVRPENRLSNNCDHDSWVSSSDSDSDYEDRRNKIKVEIKPYSPREVLPQCDNVDYIRNSMKGLHISPFLTIISYSRTWNQLRHLLCSKLSIDSTVLRNCKPSQDLWELDIFNNTPINQRPTQSSIQIGSVYSLHQSPAHLTDKVIDSAGSSSLCTPNTPGHFSFSPDNSASVFSTPSQPWPVTVSSSQRHSARSSASISISQSNVWPSSPPGDVWANCSFNRCDSLPNANTVLASISSCVSSSVCCPSPLSGSITAGETLIPLAVAFSETVHAYFSNVETSCKVKMVGDVILSFPVSMVHLLRSSSEPLPLCLKIKNIDNLEDISANQQLIVESAYHVCPDSREYNFNMTALMEHLRHEFEQNKLASYFNIEILKYQIRPSFTGASGAPLTLKSYWKHDTLRADFRLDYAYNALAFAPSQQMILSDVSILVPVSGYVTKMQCKPPGTWCAEKNRAMWSMESLSSVGEKSSQGCVRARFDLCSPMTGPYVSAVQFSCDGMTFSGIDFELVGLGYRISRVKKRFVSGKYFSEAVVT